MSLGKNKLLPEPLRLLSKVFSLLTMILHFIQLFFIPLNFVVTSIFSFTVTLDLIFLTYQNCINFIDFKKKEFVKEI